MEDISLNKFEIDIILLQKAYCLMHPVTKLELLRIEDAAPPRFIRVHVHFRVSCARDSRTNILEYLMF